ncbi:MAG TPA: polysaccharide biosynthesis/export family protein [Devosiaceae bacterium]|nr:polysaccharide biosynthesis/export family protein [Devosiaceae bacterium]
MFRVLIGLVLASMLAACTTFSSSGPGDDRIVSSASASLTMPDARGTTLQYALVDLSPAVIKQIPDYDVGSLYSSLDMRVGSPQTVTIGVGDSVNVTVFESSDGGLFIPTGNTTDCHCVNMPAQTVSSSGLITIPYADGDIHAAGMTVPTLEKTIADRLSKRAIEPQVIASVTRKSASEVTVLGDVAEPQKLVINDTGDRVLDAIARVGGVKSPPYEEFVSVTRNGRKATIYFNNLVRNSRENIYLRPGDTIFVDDQKRTFTAFGSTGITGEFDFGDESITLDQAVGKAGGLLDSRANPRQVFLYREESRSVLQRQGVDLSRFPATQQKIPTIYRANFTDPASFFYARQFPMRNGDVIYISNAPSVELDKFLSLLGIGANAADESVNTLRAANFLARGD